MKVAINPSRAHGSVAAPPSKSMAHRLLICAGLSTGESTVHGVAPSQDVLATLDCLEALGAKYKYENGDVVISGIRCDEVKDGAVLNCRECGSTLRFFIPIALLTGKRIVFTGSETLLARPLSVYEELCEKEGFMFEREPGRITVCGRLKSGEYEVQGGISSQFVSGLLFALSVAGGESVIKILPPIESGPYIDMTVQALRSFGACLEIPSPSCTREGVSEADGGLTPQRGEQVVLINGAKIETSSPSCTRGGVSEADGGVTPQRGERVVSVEGDYSNAAFFEALNLAGGDVSVTNLKEDSLQGDRVYKELFDKIKAHETVDISNCPDLGPVLMAAGALSDGAHLTGTRRLRIKESDRGEAMKAELEKFGVKTEISEDEIIVYGGKLKEPTSELSGHNDHRIVMSLAVLLSVTGGVIDGAQAVNKSFPDFFEKLGELGIEVDLSGMDK